MSTVVRKKENPEHKQLVKSLIEHMKNKDSR
jgi:hypothetical protein